MKIYFNRRPVEGPWGGGTKVLSAIVQECIIRKHEISFEEEIHTERVFDIMFCMDPRPNQFVRFEDLIQKKLKDRTSKIIQRVGDLGTHGKPELLHLVQRTTRYADLVIFPSKWAQENSGISKKSIVICNAPLAQFFVETKQRINERISIVSHHWSNNTYKGFDIYEKLDQFCRDNNQFSFTFIGRKPDNIHLLNHIEPQDVKGLIDKLPNYDLYVTASRLEAGANHVLEAMAVGLPVLFHTDGGSINEYCEGRGISYSNFEDLKNLLIRKEHENIAFQKFKRNSKDMAKEYVDILEKEHENKH
jgi:glycosyltransferase involved in cell wall biosynthesis